MFYFLFAAGLALIHIGASQLKFLETIPRNRWLSGAGGASVAYVFVHIFPELNQGQKTIEQTNLQIVNFLEHHVYLLALVGFAIFYGLEQLAHYSRQKQKAVKNIDITSIEVFWLHIGSFALYNTLIGYLLLHREETGLISLFSFFTAMGLHFLVNDYGLREHHKSMYDKVGRWILAGAIFWGWILGNLIKVNEAAIVAFFAFLAGGIILNVIKEELPEQRQSQFWAFALGSVVYASLLLIV